MKLSYSDTPANTILTYTAISFTRLMLASAHVLREAQQLQFSEWRLPLVSRIRSRLIPKFDQLFPIHKLLVILLTNRQTNRQMRINRPTRQNITLRTCQKLTDFNNFW